MSADLPHAGIHPFGSARRLGSCRSCNAECVSPICPPSGPDADCGPFVTLRPFAPPGFHRASTLLWPLLTSGPLSRARSPRVRTCTFDPCRQALPETSFGDGWISRSLARSSPVSGLTACSCSYGRVLASPCFQLGLAASTLGFATLLVTLRGYLLSGNKYMPMSGTLGWVSLTLYPSYVCIKVFTLFLYGHSTSSRICKVFERSPRGILRNAAPSASICCCLRLIRACFIASQTACQPPRSALSR